MTDKNEITAAIKKLAAAVGQCQGQDIANNAILLEVVGELAARSSDPHKYIADMYERVVTRYEIGVTMKKAAHPVNVRIDSAFRSFFTLAEQLANLRRG